mgnify:CR=1 FL=1
MSKRVKEFLSGILLGIANLIPGVSAGTMAVILGIYDELISAISNFFSEPHSRRDKLTFLVFISLLFLENLQQ